MFEGLYSWFLEHGALYALAGLFLILVIDAVIFPALPEIFAVIAFLLTPTLWWGVAILFVACCAEITGNSLLYLLVKKGKLPGFMQKAMKKWVGFLILKDERIILMNRIAPVVPFLGAFMATCEWSYRRSMLYLVIGGVLKYAGLLALVGLLNVSFDKEIAQLISIVAIIVIVCLSFASSYLYKKRLESKKFK